MKITIQKQMAEGEVWVLEVDAKDQDALKVRLPQILPIMEARLMEMGNRVIEAHTWVKQLPAEVQQATHSILGILFGKQGATEQLGMAKEVIDRNYTELLRLKEKYEPEAESSLATPPPAELEAEAAQAITETLDKMDEEEEVTHASA